MVFGGGHAVAVDEEAMEGLSALEATFFCHCFDGVVAFCLEKHHGVVELIFGRLPMIVGRLVSA